MEWNQCLNGKNAMKDVTPFLLFESTGDSEEVKAGADEEAAMDESEGVLFRFDDGDDEDNDAQSCSYDHSSYINTSYVNTHHDQTQGLIHDDFDEDDGDVDDYDDDDDDDDDTNNWGESNMMDLSMQQNGSSKCCVDSSNQREIDRNFWETCLAT